MGNLSASVNDNKSIILTVNAVMGPIIILNKSKSSHLKDVAVILLEMIASYHIICHLPFFVYSA